ncbi:MAG: Mth938-like domain-containing protein [Candidatus Hodarchaeota archaeon]
MQIIERYSFGTIQINNKSFSNDVIIFPEEVLPNWWRQEGHRLHMEDLQEIIKRKPEILIIGTGYNGAMKVPKNLTTHLEELGIKPIVKNSKEAVNAFNTFVKRKGNVAAALHLTC